MRVDQEPSLYKNVASLIRWQKMRVVKVLEEEFCLSHNDSSKRSSLFFTTGFLPTQYFYAHSPRVIARHVMMVTQFLDCNNDFVSIESKDGRMITYFCNVGYDVPGILLRLFKENIDMDINGFDSIYTPAGYRIITFQKQLYDLPPFDEEAKIQEKIIIQMVKNTGNKYAELFLSCLPKNYMIEEICSHRSTPRILRHLELFALSMEKKETIVTVSSMSEDNLENSGGGKIRVSICVKNVDDQFTLNLLKEVQKLQINMIRSYFDQFHLPENTGTIKMFSIYINDIEKVSLLEQKIKAIEVVDHRTHAYSREGLEKEMGFCIRALSDKKRTIEDCIPIIDRLKLIATKNFDIKEKEELGNFYINVLSEFFRACELIGIADNYQVIRVLLSYENVEEFFVEGKKDGKTVHKKGYRLRHSSVRGPAKGGLRLHPLAELSEVGALAFMMTWKCAKSKIKFGGGKGGATMTPNEFEDPLDYNLAISGFGKSLFLETGPFLDVPAGDVNCGAYEIGRIFEGYKAALRDLVSLVYASKFGAARVGKKLVNVKQARKILANNFEIDPYDDEALKRLMTNEHYLSLVIASQITGKPKMGVNVRNGATGRGMTYCMLAAVGQLYLSGKWKPFEKLDSNDEKLLKKVNELGESILVSDASESFITQIEWDQLLYMVYPKLLKNKTVILQGAGNVGMSILFDIEKFGVNIIGVADASGAILGSNFKAKDLDDCIKVNRGVIHMKNGVKEVIKGAKEGAAILTYECDILMPCALENAITFENVHEIKTKMVLCGANGPTSPKAAEILQTMGILDVYDFLANSGGVTASYFEWLRGLAERFRYEAEEIDGQTFNVDTLDNYIMPEFKKRIKEILSQKESKKVDDLWETILRDIMIAGLNDDYRRSQKLKVRMKISGFVDSILRVFASKILQMPTVEAKKTWATLPKGCRDHLKNYFKHPELSFENYQITAAALDS
jgi:glutamate dehydrogenase/leucine dehydrogenase